MPLLIYRVSVFVRWWRGDFPIYDTRHDGLDWMAGMGEDDVAEFSAALRGEGALRSFLEPLLDQLEDVSVDGILESLASLLPDVDRAARSDEFGEDMPASFHEGLRLGIDGWAPMMTWRSPDRGASGSRRS